MDAAGSEIGPRERGYLMMMDKCSDAVQRALKQRAEP